MAQALDRLKELLQSGEGQEQYVKWLAQNMTQSMLLAGRELAMQQVAENSDRELGLIRGASNMLDFIESPVRAPLSDRTNMYSSMPQPAYRAPRKYTNTKEDTK